MKNKFSYKKTMIFISMLLSVTAAALFPGSGLKVSASGISPAYYPDTEGIYRSGYYGCDGELHFTGNGLPDKVKTNAKKAVKTTAVLMFTGDLMCLKGQQYAALKSGKYDFTPSYQYVRKIFNEADLKVGNLESLISASNPLTKDQVNAENGSPQCNGPASYLKALRKTGFDVLVTANNHCCDWGRTGIEETLDMLDTYGFCHTGTRRMNDEVPNYVIINVNDINIGIISTTHLVNQRSKLSSDEMSRMVNNYSAKTLRSDIKAARKNGAEFIVVYAHWGIENTHELVDYQKSDAKAMAEAGADLIIGSHPHCLQKNDEIITDDNRTVPVIYSMGNFVSSMARDINNDTIILKVILEKTVSDGDKTAKTADTGKNSDDRTLIRIKKYTYIPCHVLSGDFVITPTSFSSEETAKAYAALKPDIKKNFDHFIPGASGRSALQSAEKRIRNIFKSMKIEKLTP